MPHPNSFAGNQTTCFCHVAFPSRADGCFLRMQLIKYVPCVSLTAPGAGAVEIRKMQTGIVHLPHICKVWFAKMTDKLQSSDFAKRAPEFMAVLTGTGEYAYQAEEGIYVIPLRALGV